MLPECSLNAYYHDLQVLASCSPETMQLALRRIFPYPCRKHYTAITLLPQRPWYQRPRPVALALVSTAAATASVYAMIKYRRK